jgi:DNA-binding Lrp family transcriptional regulator
MQGSLVVQLIHSSSKLQRNSPRDLDRTKPLSTQNHNLASTKRREDLRSFILVKAEPGKEQEIQSRLKALPEVREIHLITGKFDFLVALESQETELDPRQKVIELVLQEVRKSGGVSDTRTIIPISSQYHQTTPSGRPTIKAFVFIQSEAGKEKEVISKLLNLSDVWGVHLLFGKAAVEKK